MNKLKYLLLILISASFISGGIYLGNIQQIEQTVGATPALNTAQGGTGTTTKPTVGQILVGQSNGTYAPKATSSLGLLSLSALSNTATGLTYNNTNGVTSLTSGYEIPKTASTSNWQTAFGWGNHALAGYLTTYTESDPIVKAQNGIITSNGSTISSITDNSSNWSTAYTDRLKWDGGSASLVAATGRTSLGLGTMSLLANTGSTSINTVGTITNGTWNAGALTSSGALTVNGTGNSYVGGRLGVGTSTFYSSSILQISSSAPSYLQAVLQNTNSGATSSADFIVQGDKGTDVNYYTDLGQNSSGFSQSWWTINGANDSYLYAQDGNMSIGVASSSKYLSFFTGGTLAANERMRITSTGSTTIGTTTPAINALLTVYGQIYSTIANFVTRLSIPTSSTLVTNSPGEMGIDTSSDQFRYYGTATRTVSYILTPSLTVASTTLWGGAATTTLLLGYAGYNETWTNVICGTDTGTSTLRFGDGTNWTNVITATTTPISTTLSSNNAFVNLENRKLQVMTTDGSPNYISCTIRKTIDSD